MLTRMNTRMKAGLVAVALITSSVSAIDIAGVVVDEGGQPVNGAVVTYQCTGQSDTTGLDGVFEISDMSALVCPVTRTRQGGIRAAVAGDGIRVETDRTLDGVVVSLYTLTGRLVFAQPLGSLVPGSYRVPLDSRVTVSGRYIARVTHQGESLTTGGVPSVIGALSKQAACDADTIQVVVAGFVSETVVVAPQTDSVTVVMSEAGVVDISVDSAYALYQARNSDTNFVVLDIRTPSEYGTAHIAGAVNIDYYDAAFADQIAALDKSKTYLVHCRSGSRSGAAMPTFTALGFEDVQNMLGGFNAWDGAGYPTVN